MRGAVVEPTSSMRETIAGFYGAHWWRFMGTLAIFVVLAWVLGLVLRRPLISFNRGLVEAMASTKLM